MHSSETIPTIPNPPRAPRAGSVWARTPLWLVAAVILGIIFLWVMLTDPDYEVILAAVIKGVGVTIQVTLISFALAVVLGLIVGLARVSNRRLTYEAASFYVEIIRGVPMLVLLYYIVFAGAPAMVTGINLLGEALSNVPLLSGPAQAMMDLTVRQISFQSRVIMALTIGYSAFLAEIFRAGIQSIERGQMEAARSLGMSYPQAMRHVILPQAIRRVLPPLGNDFIAMLKDSSLVSVMGVADITYQGRVYAASTFKFFETYNVVGFLYLVMTIGLALLVRGIEKRTKTAH